MLVIHNTLRKCRPTSEAICPTVDTNLVCIFIGQVKNCILATGHKTHSRMQDPRILDNVWCDFKC